MFVCLYACSRDWQTVSEKASKDRDFMYRLLNEICAVNMPQSFARAFFLSDLVCLETSQLKRRVRFKGMSPGLYEDERANQSFIHFLAVNHG